MTSTQTKRQLQGAFETFIKAASFPCVGAKSALGKDRLTSIVVRDITVGTDDAKIYRAIAEQVRAYRANPEPFRSLAVIFSDDHGLDEQAFERALWQRLQALSDIDEAHGESADPRVGAEADDADFAISFAGEGFFVVGLHPGSSRPARRFERPALIFNIHDQFELLRDDGRYGKLRETITSRDQALAGNSNPMLAAHGEISAARQYSGRAVGADWVCPFHRAQKEPDHAH